MIRRPPLSRVAGFAIGVAIALGILAIELPPAASAFWTLAATALVIGLALTAVAVRAATRGSGPPGNGDARIRREGILGRAIVLAATPTGRRDRDRTEVELRLEVQLPTRRRFEVRRREWLDAGQAARIVVGRPIVVAADPAQPGHVVAVLDIPDVDQAAIDALGPIAGGPGGAIAGGAIAGGAGISNVTAASPNAVTPSGGEPAPDR